MSVLDWLFGAAGEVPRGYCLNWRPDLVALLQTTREFLALALDNVEIVIREAAPFLLHLAFELCPVSFNAIPIHRAPPYDAHINDSGFAMPRSPLR